MLSDGFVTRPGLKALTFGKITPDEALVKAAIGRLEISRLDAVFCMHSHYDHAMDAPIWVRGTGSHLVGSESTANVGRGLDQPLRPLPYILGDISFVLDRLLDLARRDGVQLQLPIAWDATDPFAGLDGTGAQ